MLAVAPLLVALLGCFGDRLVCESRDQVIAEADGDTLTCADADTLVDWIEVLAARPAAKQRAMATAGLRDRYKRDPVGTRAWLTSIDEQRRMITSEKEFDGAERRSEVLYALVKGQGLVTEADGTLWKAVDKAVSVWNVHDEDRLALAEADIETWILYGSLCRQVQGAGVLRISVADRVTVYATMGERWKHGTRTERIAMTALGPYWHSVKAKWDLAPYDKQQAWATNAPLPPPMTATSLGYLEAILEGDLIGHAASIHEVLGPLSMERF